MDSLKSRQPASKIIQDKSLLHHVKKYKVCGHLGKGGFANVYQVQSIDSNKIYACKVITKSKLVHNEHKRKLVSEIKLHQSLQHKNIVRFERHFEDKTNVYILLECCHNRSLMELSMKRTKLTENEVRYFMLQILIAIKYLHSRCIIHRDLKLGNLLLDRNLNVKICDFGLAAKLEFDSERKTTICGTPNYTAPEILNQRRTGNGHSYEVDIWSIGVIMFTLLCGKPPFETKNIKETYRRIKKIKYEFPINSDQYISLYAKNLISKIFTKEPTKRPNLLQIRNHSFFKQLPIPKALPLTILKRAPTNKELFPPSNNKENISANANIKQKAPIISTGYNQKINSNYDSSNKKRTPILSTGYNQKINSNFMSHNFMKYNHNFMKQNQYKMENVNENENKNEDDDIKNIITKNKLHSKISNEKRGIVANIIEKKTEIADFISIIKYVDYTKKYGFGYILSNGSTGIYFNDSTKILLLQNKQNVIYINNKQVKQNCTMKNYPMCLKKKLTLLKHFSEYLWKCTNDKNTNDDKKEKENENDILNKQLTALQLQTNTNTKSTQNNNNNNLYLKTFVSDHYCMLFKLSNNAVQVQFTDKSQIIIMDKYVLYKDKLGNKNIFQLNQVESSNKKDLRKRCKYTQQLLRKITAKKS